MPCGKKKNAMCHNFGPSGTIVMDDGDQQFEKTIYVQKSS